MTRNVRVRTDSPAGPVAAEVKPGTDPKVLCFRAPVRTGVRCPAPKRAAVGAATGVRGVCAINSPV